MNSTNAATLGESLMVFLSNLEEYHVTTVSALVMSFVSLLAHTGVFSKLRAACRKTRAGSVVADIEQKIEDAILPKAGGIQLVIPPETPPRRKRNKKHPRLKKVPYMATEDEDSEEEVDLESSLVEKGSV